MQTPPRIQKLPLWVQRVCVFPSSSLKANTSLSLVLRSACSVAIMLRYVLSPCKLVINVDVKNSTTLYLVVPTRLIPTNNDILSFFYSKISLVLC